MYRTYYSEDGSPLTGVDAVSSIGRRRGEFKLKPLRVKTYRESLSDKSMLMWVVNGRWDAYFTPAHGPYHNEPKFHRLHRSSFYKLFYQDRPTWFPRFRQPGSVEMIQTEAWPLFRLKHGQKLLSARGNESPVDIEQELDFFGAGRNLLIVPDPFGDREISKILVFEDAELRHWLADWTD